MKKFPLPPGFQDMLGFGLVEALLGRRSRRFFLGAEIPDGVLAYKSKHPPIPLSELEKLLVVLACGGNTAWHHLIYRAARYAPHLSNYCGAAGGRTFPSSAGFETSQTFFTDDAYAQLVCDPSRIIGALEVEFARATHPRAVGTRMICRPPEWPPTRCRVIPGASSAVPSWKVTRSPKT